MRIAPSRSASPRDARDSPRPSGRGSPDRRGHRSRSPRWSRQSDCFRHRGPAASRLCSPNRLPALWPAGGPARRPRLARPPRAAHDAFARCGHSPVASGFAPAHSRPWRDTHVVGPRQSSRPAVRTGPRAGCCSPTGAQPTCGPMNATSGRPCASRPSPTLWSFLPDGSHNRFRGPTQIFDGACRNRSRTSIPYTARVLLAR